MQAKQIEEAIERMAAPIAERFGVEVEDVEFVKEGQSYFLRVYLDKDGGVTIDDCENVSRALSDALDENDPTDAPYCLEVSSPGLDRRLYKPKHFEKYNGRKVDVKFFKAVEGKKMLTGILTGFENGIVAIDLGKKELTFPLSEAAYVRLTVEF